MKDDGTAEICQNLLGRYRGLGHRDLICNMHVSAHVHHLVPCVIPKDWIYNIPGIILDVPYQILITNILFHQNPQIFKISNNLNQVKFALQITLALQIQFVELRF